mgnify:CR=1 FL=1
MEYLTLNNGIRMPLIGFGTFMLGGGTCTEAVSAAIENGCRMIDTAEAYGNEKEVGKGIKQSGVAREELFLVTKVNFKSYEKAAQAVRQSLAALQTDYIDLLLLHWPFANYYAAWRSLEKLYTEGKVRAIGVSNFEPDQLLDLIAYNKVVPAVNQIETNPLFQQKASNKFLKGEGIQHEAWAPFAEGQCDIFNNPTLKAIAANHGKTTAQVVLRWLNQRGIAVIPKSVRRERMEENISILDFTLSDVEMEAISLLDTGRSPIYDDSDLSVTRYIGTLKIH